MPTHPCEWTHSATQPPSHPTTQPPSHPPPTRRHPMGAPSRYKPACNHPRQTAIRTPGFATDPHMHNTAHLCNMLGTPVQWCQESDTKVLWMSKIDADACRKVAVLSHMWLRAQASAAVPPFPGNLLS